MLIKVKMPVVNVILTFITMIHFVLLCDKFCAPLCFKNRMDNLSTSM